MSSFNMGAPDQTKPAMSFNVTFMHVGYISTLALSIWMVATWVLLQNAHYLEGTV